MNYTLLLLVNIFIYLHLQKRGCVCARTRIYRKKREGYLEIKEILNTFVVYNLI
nr:MAG TPA: hypothetical protein [Crassvirales sp.]